MKFCLSFIATIVSLNTYCQDGIIWSKDDSVWDYVAKSDNRIYLMKKVYETKEGTEVKVWTKTFNSSVTVGKVKKPATIEKTLMVYDCYEKKMKILQYTSYNMSGKLLKRITVEEYDEKWNYVIPETISENLLNKACSLQESE